MRKIIPALLATLALTAPAVAGEGMWTFDNVPFAKIRAETGASIDQAWLSRVQQAAVRLSTGCSASVVSSDGLVATNHHCVSTCAADLSSPKVDYLKNGFFTAARTEEKACPGMQAEIVVALSDVTARINAATQGLSGDPYIRARDRAMAEAERATCDASDKAHRCQTISFYGGRQYKLFKFRRYEDVRLVFAPESDIAFFGGDPDNFNFPRYDLDVSFVRLYEGNQPVKTPVHLTWSQSAPAPGEAVFVVGNPGTTNRAFTLSQLATQRDLVLPISQQQRSELRGRLIEYGRRSAEHRRVAQDTLFGIENSYKNFYGQHGALTNPAFMAVKEREEADLKAKVRANAQLAQRIGDPWADIEKAQASYADRYLTFRMLEQNAGYGSQLYAYARTLVRAARERAKPADQRNAAFAESRLPILENDLLEEPPIDNGLEQMLLEFWLLKTREALTADHPAVKALIGRESPESLSARLVKGTTLKSKAVRKALWDGGLSAIQASKDPLIQYVLANDALGEAQRDAWAAEVTAPIERAQTRLADARFAIYGDTTYPDANFSQRISYGKVEGWTYRGQAVPAATNFAGLYERATGQFPFALTKPWIDNRGSLTLSTVFNFSSSNDIIGGNSGSPVINAKGEIVGLAFDGNIHSLGGSFGYDPALNRTVSVSTVSVSEALAKVYKRTALAAELKAP